MSLKDTIRSQITEATKNRKDSQKNVLKVILGEIDTQESRANPKLGLTHPAALADVEIHKIIKKTLQGIEEMLQYKPDDEGLQVEKATLQALLPKELTEEDIKNSLAAKVDEIKAAKSEGQATGVVMKFFKEQSISVDGSLVKKIVAELRAPKECDDCGIKTDDLITKGDHHGGMKTVCTDRNACHARGG